ncbi:alkaline phosphatase family protein [Ktedonosporobacter rubrisoli]|uniref:Alkaline phosphatase family protein n=1 Tax=Ktedonosporobacter rubrisoli TaxID=2509675 RepID=A0A4P6JT83_KTERU|nr:nucleotide pyrophosphatase/phosphodiesterase family protein [Ktedonosporobacter rubrisoli]QBD78777.1 alkaline phosphatase family protein [Ktedonosporobacter rubrisoli]
MHKTVVINVVGLTSAMLNSTMPRLTAFMYRGALASIKTSLPAVTCSMQTTFLTGCQPGEHGIVGNGWYFRDECTVKFWQQAASLVQRPRIWEQARALDENFTCANLFWWYNMYAPVEYMVTPRPMYPADGRKLADIYTRPADLRGRLQAALGQFPLFNFWGPGSSLAASRWIAEAAQMLEKYYDPTLTLIYLPHLDYCLQRYGPHADCIEGDLRELDALCGELLDFYAAHGARIIFLSEYGIMPVARAIHLNRELRKYGLLAIREEQGHELLDAGASAAFAVADHQIAHVYVNDARRMAEVGRLLRSIDGVEQVLDVEGKRAFGLEHARSGDFVVVAAPNAWFSYYYWLDDKRAPDYARTVDIHRKPGYDPVELFVDPSLRFPRLTIGRKLLQQRLGLRSLLDVIPLDASLVRGSHGRVAEAPEYMPVLLTQFPELLEEPTLEATQVSSLILQHLLHEPKAKPVPIRLKADIA